MSVPPTSNADVRASRGGGLMLVVLLSATFMGQFDFFVVNVAAPSLQRDLHAGAGALELIVGGYAFAYASAMITAGRLGDLFGHRRLFVVGTSGFALTSLLCALAQNTEQLVAARLAQGLTGALMIPQVLALITATSPPKSRASAFGWYSAAAGLGSIAGQVLGGLLIQADVAGLAWRTIFLVTRRSARWWRSSPRVCCPSSAIARPLPSIPWARSASRRASRSSSSRWRWAALRAGQRGRGSR